MVTSPMMARYGNYHVRSTSFPSTSHPLTARVEEELNKCRSWLVSKSNTAEVLQDRFGGLAALYESVEDLLHSTHTQQLLLHHRLDRCVEKMLDGSLGLLDVSSTTRDVLSQMREHVQQNQSGLRRRRSSGLDFRNEFHDYMFSSRKINKVISKYLGESRKNRRKYSFSQLEKDKDFVAVLTVLKEVEAITHYVCEALLNFLLGSKRGKQSGWSLVSSLMNRKIVLQKKQDEGENEVEMVHSAILALTSNCYEVQNAQRQLEKLEMSIQLLEEKSECMYRGLMRIRVTLLNILSN